ncbi:MAG: radical SAM protein [Candidatus Saganbacteria bacterium]|nr:radical SAM protein [Candidatus Saganbacteria bacterium]
MNKFLQAVSGTSRPVVIFGASVIGKIVLDSLEILNIKPAAFCDNDARKQNEPFHGYPVISFERLRADYPAALVIVAAGRYFNEISRQLAAAGFNDVFSDSDVIGCIDFRRTPRASLEKIMWHLAKIGQLAEMMEFPAGDLHVPRLNVVITTRCTLKCRHCSSLMPHYRKPADSDTSEVIAALDGILSGVDLIYHVELLGGEPFLHKDFAPIARHLLDSGKVLHLDVVTNGTVVPAERELESLKHDKVSVVIDDYGELSGKLAPLTEALRRHGIDFRVNRHWAWADLGGFEPRRRTEAQLKELFAKCNFNSCAELLDGVLYHCPRSSHGTKTGLIPDYPADALRISALGPDRAAAQERLRAFFLETAFLRACDHCDGNTSDSLKLAPAGQNMRGVSK